MRSKIEKKFKNLDGHVETTPMIPYNPGFGPVLEMIILGGRRDPSEGSWGAGEVKNWKRFKNFNGRVETIPMIPHNLGFGSILEMTLLGGRWDPLEGSWEGRWGRKLKKVQKFWQAGREDSDDTP